MPPELWLIIVFVYIFVGVGYFDHYDDFAGAVIWPVAVVIRGLIQRMIKYKKIGNQTRRCEARKIGVNSDGSTGTMIRFECRETIPSYLKRILIQRAPEIVLGSIGAVLVFVGLGMMSPVIAAMGAIFSGASIGLFLVSVMLD